MKDVHGVLVRAGQAMSCRAIARQGKRGEICLFEEDAGSLLIHEAVDTVEYASVIPGLPVDLVFAEGHRFTPDDPRFRWPGMAATAHWPEWLESHWLVVCLSVLLIPAFVWAMIAHVIPSAARASVAFFPPFVAEQLDEQTLEILDRVHLDPTTLDEPTQKAVERQWGRVINELALPADQYHVIFRQSDLGANALALPNGTVIVTDDLVELTRENPEALTAILLHEIGHVQYQHGMQMLAQATATSLLFTLLLGDVSGAGEVVLGAGLGLAQNAFSRDMERQADQYAIQQLKQLSISPLAFADAMALLMASRRNLDASGEGPEEEGGEGGIMQYLSTHPGMEERIRAARDASDAPLN